MEEQHVNEYSFKDIINHSKKALQYLRGKWLWLVIPGIIGGLLGFWYYYVQKSQYTADCTFILEEKSTGSGLTGLASQFGLDLSSMGSGASLFAGDNLLEIIPSKNIVERVLLSKVDGPSDQTLADLFLDFTKMKKRWAKQERLANINFNKVLDIEQMSLMQDSVLNVIYKQVVKSHLKVEWVRKKATLIKVSVTSNNEQFSKYLTERVVSEARRLYIDIKTYTSQANVNRLQNRADSLLELLNDKSYQTAESQILNVNPAMKTAIVPTEIFSRDKSVLATIYAEVVKNLETSKILLSQQTPVIQIMDKPRFPLEGIKLGRLFLTLLWAFIFSFISSIVLGIKYLLTLK